MARGGVYKTEVQKARRSLLAQGKHPSVDAVRVALGNTGSKTTIHRYLKELEAEEGGPTGSAVSTSDALQDLVSRLAAQLHAEADARIEEVRSQSASERQAQQVAAELVAQEAAQFRAQAERAEAALADTRGRLTEIEAQLQAARVEAAAHTEREAGLVARVQEQEAHAASLEQKHVQAREALEHFRTTAKEQREQELRRHEHQVQGLQAEVRQLQEALTGKNQEILTLSSEGVRLAEQIAAFRKEQHAQQASLRELETELNALRPLPAQLQTLRAQWGTERESVEVLRAELAGARQELAAERQLRSEADARATASAASLAAFEGVFAKWDIPRPVQSKST
jgi:chromosome segregation ATPase